MAARYDTIGRRLHGAGRRPGHVFPRTSSVGAVGEAERIVNVERGQALTKKVAKAGTLVAVEPSAVMIEQRPPDAAPVVQAGAEHLPFPAASFDAAIGILTVHHWSDLAQGLSGAPPGGASAGAADARSRRP